ncbi:hypothetical protein G7Z17_g6437 [Cylindrodendrum hubeiense]|uniref:NmrA-like domain-containing protein n=1 Tax=Cylindrodendrum hubeiense TaxID=595255 RepID=A0A9P5H915_9HYPO|nr:hypothetical protein G7Z17_g6437 [Cylindrodendrum hubeiense]
MTGILLTGASGYIGGDLLHLLAKSHPEYRVRALIRDTAKGDVIKKKFSQVQIVDGGLDDTELLAREAKDADVVLHLAATGHLSSVKTIHQALLEKSTTQTPPYWIQISGASALAAAELADQTRSPGTGTDIVWNDLDGIDAIRSIIKDHPSRAVDNYMLSVADETSHIKSAIVMPPIIYGRGRGPINQRSIQIPELAKATLKLQRGLQVGSGQSRWGNVHIQDLSQLIVKLVENALEGRQDKSVWGSNGIFLTSLRELSFGEISRRITSAAYDLDLLPNKSIDQLNKEQSNELLPHGAVLYGTNARSQAQRAEKFLGWKAENLDLEHEIPLVVAQEACGLGLMDKKGFTPRI